MALVLDGDNGIVGVLATNNDGDVIFDTNTLFVDAVENKVGIGTTSPVRQLHLASAIPSIRLEDTDVSGAYNDIVLLSTGELSIRVDQGNVQAGSSLSFRIDNTEKMRIDSSGSVKINNGNLHIERSGSSPLLQFTDTGVNSRWIGLVDGTSNFTIYGTNGSTQELTLDSLGNLLLGKSTVGTGTVGVELNPDGTLVGTRSGGNPLFLNRTTSDGKIITLRKDGNEIGYLGSNTAAGQSLLDISSENDSSSNIRFLTYGSGSHNEVMRLASNKMIGIGITAPTASWGNGTGVQFNPAGEVLASKVNGTSLYLNRTSSSGSNRAVISINENNSNIGTIGMGSGSELAISTNSGTRYISQKLNGDTDGVQYSDVGTYHFGPWISKNATVDLGRSNAGWRDLYLTGGIQFDARSNKLDDYEEGEWTYSLPCVGSGSMNVRAGYQKGFYTKVGRLVTIHLRYESSGRSSPSGDIELHGLPFNVDTVAPNNGSASFTYPILLRGASSSSYEWDYSFHIGLIPGTTTGKFYGQGDGSTHSYRALQPGDISSNFEGSISLTYKTNQ